VIPHSIGTAAIAAALTAIAYFLGAHAAFASSQCGKATWYEAGGITASGEQSATDDLAGAHSTLPFGTQIEVENLGNGRTTIVRINDRGRFTSGRIVGVSRAAAEQLGFIHEGVARVRLTVIDGADPLDGSCPENAEGEIESAGEAVPLLRYPPETADSMSARFGLAFQPESWAEFEMNKALEALLSRGDGR
jgi:rare lipoprotein A